MSDFEKLVVECRIKKLNKDISNSAWSHALILFRNLFQVAIDDKKNVRIVTGTLNPEFYDTLAELAKKCLEKQKIELVVLDSESNLCNNRFAQEVKNSVNGELIQPSINIHSGRNHFIVVGDEHYRLELDHERTKAVANFNNAAVGHFLNKMFVSIKEYVQAPDPVV